MVNYKEINLKELTAEQKPVIKHINNMIIEHQQIFQMQPEELVISKKDFEILSSKEDYNYLVLGKIKIYKV